MNRSNSIYKTIRKDLFDTKSNFIISSLIILFAIYLAFNMFTWILFKAKWQIVSQNILLYIFGSFPTAELWRPAIWLISIIILAILSLLSPRKKYIKRFLVIFWLLIIPIGLFLLSGGIGMSNVPTRYWGGLTLTLLLTGSSAIIALPLGVILALGRQSNLSIIRRTCSSYIDIMRALPLISVLFFGQLLIPLFLPMDLEINRVFRAVLAFAIFTSAYIAEDIRGGLQAIPITQNEAAAVLGLNQRQILQVVILPQALRTALPALTNQAIGLLQNTSLMAILGLVELLGISRSLLANPKFIGSYLEAYIWLAALYWFACTALALLSKKLETRLNEPTNADNNS